MDEETTDTGETTETAAAVPPRRATWMTRTRVAVAGGAAAVLIAGSLGGFAVGRATAGGGDDQPRFDRQGVPSGFLGEGTGPQAPQGQPPRDDADDDQDGRTNT